LTFPCQQNQSAAGATERKTTDKGVLRSKTRLAKLLSHSPFWIAGLKASILKNVA